MRILVFSDLYRVEKVPEVDCDLIVILGNVSKAVVSRIVELYDEKYILGLHSNLCAADLYADTPVIDIHERVVEIDGFRFSGYGGIPSYSNSGRGYFTENACASFVNQLAVSEVDVLLTYCNPAYGDLDGTDAKEGFVAFHQVFTKKLTKYFIHGRLHQNLKRRLAKIDTHMVYETKLIKIER